MGPGPTGCMLGVLLLVCTHARLLAVLGLGDASSQRLLVETDEVAHVELQAAQGGRVMARATVQPNWGRPQVVKLPLDAGVADYVGTVGGRSLAFTTRVQRVVFASCNRHALDGDSSLLASLADTPRDLAVHLGDQVYLDAVVQEAHALSDQQLTERIRMVYRTTWMEPHMARFLLSSRHVMLPDDHDVVNNLDGPLAAQPGSARFIAAARQCYAEYQQALRHDDAAGRPVFEFLTVAPNLALVLLDTRFERAFAYANDSTVLLGPRQLAALAEWKPPATVEHVVLVSAVPLLTIGPLLARVIHAFEAESYPLHRSHREVEAVLSLFAALHRPGRTLYSVAGDLHHYARSRVTVTRSDGSVHIDSLVTSGLTTGSTAARSNHIAAMVFFASLLPPTVGPFAQSAPHELFLGTNFVEANFSLPDASWHVHHELLEPWSGPWLRNALCSAPVGTAAVAVGMATLLLVAGAVRR